MSLLGSMEFKFFPRDLISGKMEKAGDEFTALLMGAETKFRVTQADRGCVMALLAEDRTR